LGPSPASRVAKRKGYFVLFRGYIDESYGKNQNVFALSCLIANESDWFKMERAWKLQLAAKNKQLKKAGRPLISRYHASDCSGRRREFKDWALRERDAFVLGLFSIFKRTPVQVIAYTAQLDDLCVVFPEYAEDRLATAYTILLKFLMQTLGDEVCDMARGAPVKIYLFHDRTSGDGKYDPTLLRTFNQLMNDPDFRYKDYFTSITSVAWQDCLALQPADLVAFECFKEAEGRLESRNRRRSLDGLLNMETFGIRVKMFTKDVLMRMRASMESRGKLAKKEPQ
jgi:hypothetical protein